MPRALISVFDKTGIADFARGLAQRGWEIVSTGGTAKLLAKEGISVIPIEQITGFPEMLDGRVKTLHPAVHGGLLARRDLPEHLVAIRQHGIAPIDLVAVNLYPFRETVARPGVTFEEAVEQIDIGGPSMLRSAAKNHAAVLPVVDPADFEKVLAALDAGGADEAFRRSLAAKVFAHTSAYDGAIATYLGEAEPGELPPFLTLPLSRLLPLRYGENPAQRAALYSTDEPGGVRRLKQFQGKELSFNNILDLDGALLAISPWTDRTACAIIKHTTPCGIALAGTPAEAYAKALATDPTSAFGSVIAFNRRVDAAAAEAMRELFVEVVVAPSFEDAALAVYARKKNLRVVSLEPDPDAAALDFKRVRGGLLVQDRFRFERDESSWTTPTRRRPTDAEWKDLRFAWAAVAGIKSNAILLARNEAAIGIGAGQMSRVDASFLAVHKARKEGLVTQGSVLASDAFFPFPDGVEEAAAAGVRAIIQPGGSVRDPEVIAAADAHDIAMVLTGRRQFRH
jgi:phosphoribosylaminoimidazolecarboxamide formyltransferase/IMP cyclohydrolase